MANGVQPLVQRCRALLGTFVEVTVAGELAQEQLVCFSGAAFVEIERIQRALSFHHPDSELTRLNRHAAKGDGELLEISADLRRVLTLAGSLAAATDGAFDVCVGSQRYRRGQVPAHLPPLSMPGCAADVHMSEEGVRFARPVCMDLGGIAKGYAVDRVFECLPGELDVAVNAGGDLRLRHWQGERVQLRYGRSPRAVKLSILRAPALATSGHYYRRAITHGVTGKTRHRGGSVSVFAGEAMLADALTKVVWLLGDGASPVLAEHNASAVCLNRFGCVTNVPRQSSHR